MKLCIFTFYLHTPIDAPMDTATATLARKGKYLILYDHIVGLGLFVQREIQHALFVTLNYLFDSIAVKVMEEWADI